jgi:hypothetical protein
MSTWRNLNRAASKKFNKGDPFTAKLSGGNFSGKVLKIYPSGYIDCELTNGRKQSIAASIMNKI